MILGVADHTSLKMPLHEFLTFASELKVEAVELRADKLELLSILEDSSRDRAKIKELLETYGFKRFVHAPSIGVNLASLNPTLREASEKVVMESVRFAAEIEGDLLVVHVGRLSKDYPQEFLGKAVNNAINSLKKINSFSRDLGVTLTIENDHKAGDYVLAGHAGQILSLIENIKCKLTFDIGHANTFGKPEEAADLLKEHIVNIHLHDNDGRKDSHLPLGKGNINFEEAIGKIGCHANLSLICECHSLKAIEESLGFIRRKLLH